MLGLTLNRTIADKTKSTFKFDKILSKKPRILLVDDNDFNILIAGTYLENFGYDYDISKSGHDALEKIRKKTYAAILMDIQMPIMDGMETTQLIREFEAKTNRPRQPIIALTAHPFSGDRENCQTVGMDEYLSKPFNPAHLKELIEKFLVKEDA